MSERDRREPTLPLAAGEALRAQKSRRRLLHTRILFGALGAAIVIGSAVFPPTPRLVWNASASAPVGLYWVSPNAMLQPGDMVIARVPRDFRRLAAERGYLPLNVPLVKRVAAAPGDEVCARGPDIFVNGHRLAERVGVDAAGRELPGWSGCVRLRGRQVFLLMPAISSFDGRYFGVTEGADIVGKARLLWAR